MYVYWKILFGFGIAFWIAMVALEYFFDKSVQVDEFSKAADIAEESASILPDVLKVDVSFDYYKTALWSLSSFLVSVTFCMVLKIVTLLIRKSKEETMTVPSETSSEVEPPGVKDSSSRSKIPVMILPERKPSLHGDSRQTGSNTLETVKDFTVTTDKSEYVYNFKSQCNKLKDEMVDMQINSLKDYNALTKKLEIISKEKKSLATLLEQSQKENSATKKQLNDVLSDRDKLIKRLEAATKEIKSNTNCKKMTLDKLEEAINYSNEMKSQILRLTDEKEMLENKLEIIESQYRCLQQQTVLLQCKGENVEMIRDLTGTISDIATDNDTEIDLTQSDRDIEKVQMKLHDLERSLEKMRLTTTVAATVSISPRQGFNSSDVTSDSAVTTETDLCERSEYESCPTINTCPQVNLKTFASNEMWEENVELVAARDADYDKIFSYPVQNPDCVDSESDSSSLSTIHLTSSSEQEAISDTNSELIVHRPGIVSQSPQFQDFMCKMLDSEKTGLGTQKLVAS